MTDRLSNSRLNLFASDPEEYAAVYVHKTRTARPASTSQQLGTDIENWLFHGKLPGVVILPDRLATPDGRKSDEYRALKMANLGKRLLSTEQALADPKLSHFAEIANNVQLHAVADALIYGSDHAANHSVFQTNVTIHDVILWTDQQTGVQRCCQLDLYKPGDYIADLKASRSVEQADFEKDIYEYRYHWQAATYVDAVYELTGQTLPFFWIVVKNNPGYGVEVFHASDEQIDLGRYEYRQALRRWVAARDSGLWRSATFSTAPQVNLPFYIQQKPFLLWHKQKPFLIR